MVVELHREVSATNGATLSSSPGMGDEDGDDNNNNNNNNENHNKFTTMSIFDIIFSLYFS